MLIVLAAPTAGAPRAALAAEAPPPGGPATLALLPPSGVNLHPGILEAARDVFKGHLLRTGRYTVLVPEGAPTTSELPPRAAADQGKALGTDLSAVLHVARLARVATVRLTIYRTADASLAHADDLQAATPDDLDPVLARLATGLATGRSARASADIDTVSLKETDPLLKRTATRTVGVRLGSLFAFNRSGTEDESRTVPGFGFFWLYDARHWLADVALDFHPSEDNTFVSIGIGAYYPFARQDTTPYVGLAARFSGSDFGGAGASGLTVQPTLGFLLGRLSTVQLRADVGYFVNTYSERSDDFNQQGITSSRHLTHGPSISIGAGF
jgi:hypothetical protein